MPTTNTLRHRMLLTPIEMDAETIEAAAERVVSDWIDRLPEGYVVPLDSVRLAEIGGRPHVFVVAHHERARLDVHRAEVWGMANKQALLQSAAAGVQVARGV